MKFCQHHWDALKQAIKSRGLFDLVARDGHEALEQAVGELKGEPKTLKNFDPLMSAHWQIVNNAMETLGAIGANPLALMASDPDHPECECPICYLNYLSEEHDRTCTEPTCTKKKGLRFDDWIQKAADGALEYSKTLI